jgi:cupin fold WbuC family metalloprotein
MEIIKSNDIMPYAIHIKVEDLKKEKSQWFTENEWGLQVAGCSYNKGKEFAAHKHIFRERVYEYTQEAVIVIQGELLVTIYNREKELISAFHLKAGDMGLFLQGGHGYKVLEDNTIYYELKNGPFTTKEEDKDLIA